MRKVVRVGAENSVTPCDQWMHVYEAAEAIVPVSVLGRRCAMCDAAGSGVCTPWSVPS